MHFTKTAVYTVVLLASDWSHNHGAYPSSYYGDVSANPYSNEVGGVSADPYSSEVGGVSADPYQSIKYSDEEGQKKEINNAQYRRLVRRQAISDPKVTYQWDNNDLVYEMVVGPGDYYESKIKNKLAMNYKGPTTTSEYYYDGAFYVVIDDKVPDEVKKSFH
ncbi:hypothetical protein BDF19DRAFT_411814 [Syncephalis fuscata]|nr:hypothetical protein BDF19DRAFT_411814 [Syncephalis fuscata]